MASRSKSPDRWLRSPLTLALSLLVLTGVVFGPTLASAHQEVMAHRGTDLAMYFAHARAFSAQHLRQGHIPLWNPHICGGVPFVGAWQSGVFYPPNAIYLFLPLHLALNVELFLHVFLCGWFTALWARRYTAHPLACLLAGTMVMFGGAFFLHVYAGHCSLLAAGAWMPLFLASVDGLFLLAGTQRPAPIAGYMFTGVLALAMMLLAGHPQTVFIAFVTALLYSAALLPFSRFRIRALLAFGVLAAGGAAIGAVQLLPGLQAASEGVRQGPLPYEMAASFSFLPQNLLTLLIPGFFGDMVRTPYWGGYFLWEMCLFAGGIGLMLAIAGVTAGSERRRWAWLVLVLLLLVLALGAHTPLFRLLYDHVPGFNRLRGHSRFIYPMTLFLGLLAAQGLHHLFHSPGRARPAAFVALLGALCLGGLGALLLPGLEQELGLWKRLLYDLAAREKSYLPAEQFGDIEFLDRTRAFAITQIGIAMGTLLLAGLLLLASSRKPALGHVPGVLGIAEVTLFALAMRASFPIALLDDPILRRLRVEKPGNYRVLNLAGFPNSAMRYGMYDLWGYEPAVLGRYAAFMKRTQGRDPDDGDIYLDFEATDPLLIMARLRFLILPEGKGVAVKEASPQWPHLFLVGDYQVVSGRDAIYNAVHQSSFDPLRQVVLESRPTPAPVGTPPAGRTRLLQQTTDTLIIEAETDRPALLVVTDAYSRGWRAVALPGSQQQRYTVLPANYIFRAVPLQAGRHRLRMEYAPWEFPAGLGISLVATGLYLILLVRYAWRTRRARMARREP